jgi:endonuclease/exonuclease/phosphatase (EEP) superfamily protein YafD
MLATLVLAAGALARHVPTTTALGPAARMIDSLAPWLLAGAVAAALAATLLGLRRTGGGLALAALAAGGALALDQHRLGQPLAPHRTPDLRVLYFNAFADDGARAEAILDAVLAEDADIVVLLESSAVRPALDRLRTAYAFVSPCDADTCEIVLASRTEPLRFWQMQLNPGWPPRYAVAEIEFAPGRRAFIAASHLVKPWYGALAESEAAQLAAQWAWFDGPVVAVGDFNAAPWARPLREIAATSGLRPLRWPPATWPVEMGRLGLPIDMPYTGNGAAITDIRPFGQGLGSNHMGFVVGIALP